MFTDLLGHLCQTQELGELITQVTSSCKLVAVSVVIHIGRQSPRPKNNNNNNTIWRRSVLGGEEPPRHSAELNHAPSHAGGPTQSQLSRPRSGHHISMEHQLRRKHLLLNSDTDASNEKCLKEIQRKRKRKNIFLRKKQWKKEKREMKKT